MPDKDLFLTPNELNEPKNVDTEIIRKKRYLYRVYLEYTLH